MFPNHDYGEALFKTWTDEQREAEIGKLIQGFRSGLPVGILCRMTESISGSQEAARAALLRLLSQEEREAAVAREQGGMRVLAEGYLL